MSLGLPILFWRRREIKKYKCLCCGYWTLDSRAGFDICPICFWEDDAYISIEGNEIKEFEHEVDCTSDAYDGEDVLDVKSAANNCLTLRQGRENYKRFGACEEDMKPHVRKPRRREKKRKWIEQEEKKNQNGGVQNE